MNDRDSIEGPEIHASPYLPILSTGRAPHIRGEVDVPMVMRWVLVAAIPCAAMALYNTGLQANRVMATGAAMHPGWRESVLETLGTGHAATSIWDCVTHGAVYFLPLLGVSLLAGLFAERLFAQLRQRAPDHASLAVIALLFSLCLPPTLPLWKAALGSFMGFAVGKEIFGGVGRNFLNPPLTGLAFLYFAYPGALSGSNVWIAIDGVSGATPLAVVSEAGVAGIEAAGLRWSTAAIGSVPGAMGGTSPLAAALGASVLLYAGVASWRILAGGVLGLVLAVWLLQLLGAESPAAGLPWYWHAVTGSFAFGLVFLATDPVTSAATNSGRWIYGALIGILVVVIRVANPAHREGVMLAILLGNVAAPLIDQLVARIQMHRWKASNVG
jgi:Na+-transporting NADH:ubiquinone oxidoreductase subunit B